MRSIPFEKFYRALTEKEKAKLAHAALSKPVYLMHIALGNRIPSPRFQKLLHQAAGRSFIYTLKSDRV